MALADAEECIERRATGTLSALDVWEVLGELVAACYEPPELPELPPEVRPRDELDAVILSALGTYGAMSMNQLYRTLNEVGVSTGGRRKLSQHLKKLASASSIRKIPGGRGGAGRWSLP